MAFVAEFVYRQFLTEPPVPTASFQGKTAIVTGANSGLGREACRWLIQLGAAKVILACRNPEKGRDAAKDIQSTTSCPPTALEVWSLNLSSYASVQSFAARAKNDLPRVDALIANAGVLKLTFNMTEDNEESITTNVVSLALLIFLMHPKLCRTAAEYHTQPHITVTSSELYVMAKFKERTAPEGKIFATLNDKAKSNMSDRYNVSKLLEIFVIRQLAEMSPLSSSNVVVNCVGPG